jgi:hypothetical protein
LTKSALTMLFMGRSSRGCGPRSTNWGSIFDDGDGAFRAGGGAISVIDDRAAQRVAQP